MEPEKRLSEIKKTASSRNDQEGKIPGMSLEENPLFHKEVEQPNSENNSKRLKWFTIEWVTILSVMASIATIIGTLVVFGIIRVPVNMPDTKNITPTSPTPSFVVPPEAYGTSKPGPNCDDKGGYWYTAADQLEAASTIASCTSNGLQITKPQNAQKIAQVFFRWPLHPFPDDRYSVQSQVQLNQTSCAGMDILTNNYQGYSGFICADHTWKIVIYDALGKSSSVSSGSTNVFNPKNSNNLKMEVTSTTIALTVNSDILGIVPRSPTYIQTFSISLVVDTIFSGSSSSSTFSEFIYNPKP